MRFSKYEFYNKLLDGVTVFRVTLDVTSTQLILISLFIKLVFIIYLRIIGITLK